LPVFLCVGFISVVSMERRPGKQKRDAIFKNVDTVMCFVLAIYEVVVSF